MPTILRIDGYEILIYLKDHSPPHVHVFVHGCEAIINLGCADGVLTVRQRFRFTLRETNRILKIIERNRSFLCDAWREIHDNIG